MGRYEAELLQTDSGWIWRTLYDGEQVGRPIVSGRWAPSRESALDQARRDAEHHRASIAQPERVPIDFPEDQPRQRVVIEPRQGVTAEWVAEWLDMNFQQPGMADTSGDEWRAVRGGNPLVNAHIRIEGS